MNSMVWVNSNEKYKAEITYICNFLLLECLGIKYEFGQVSTDGIAIVLNNNKSLEFTNTLFEKGNDDYLHKAKINEPIKFGRNEFTSETDIPIILGNDELNICEKGISCGIDILGSCFYMLARIEEITNTNRDGNERFPAKESITLKYGFLNRPVVNEYIEMLWNMLKYLGYEGERPKRKFEFVLTHDVDAPRKYSSYKQVIREIGGDLLKRKNLKLATKHFFEAVKFYYSRLLGNNPEDPFDSFDFIMNNSEKYKLKSHFFFMGTGKTSLDNRYNINDDFVKKLAERIKTRGHKIGFHPSYTAFNDYEQFKKEKEEVEKTLCMTLKFGREHYLRFENPKTWQIWEDNKMTWDSTLCFADHEGFRCGTCFEFHPFNLETKKELKLIEKPLIVMEGSLFEYCRNENRETLMQSVKYLIDKTAKYNGTFVLLWHNSTLYSDELRRFYLEVLDYANKYR